MSTLYIVLAALAVWFGLGLIFVSMCRAASLADQDAENALGLPQRPRTLKQHVFAVHARTLRSMRRFTGSRAAARSSLMRDHGNGSAHSA